MYTFHPTKLKAANEAKTMMVITMGFVSSHTEPQKAYEAIFFCSLTHDWFNSHVVAFNTYLGESQHRDTD